MPASLPIDTLLVLAESAGRAILEVRSRGGWTVEAKTDQSPLTQADTAANEILISGILAFSKDPIVSEENELPASVGKRFWLIDPLDGTRDFIHGQDTFVVCIALIEDEAPIFSIVHAPVSKETWWAVKGSGAFKKTEGGSGVKIHHPFPDRKLIAAGSRSMPSDRMKFLYEIFGIESVTRFGSAMKFCKVAEGVYDVYPRFGPTSEWDTAAGQLICEEAGCTVVSLKTGTPLRYGKPSFLNEGFVAIRSDIDIAALFLELKRHGLIPS